MNTFNPHASHPARAVQAWQILVGHAMRGQTLSYEELSRLMYQKAAAGVLAGILGHVAFYCKGNELPILTAIVVGKYRGTPGEQIPLAPDDVDVERQKVFKYDWYNVYPPTEDALRSAFENASP